MSRFGAGSGSHDRSRGKRGAHPAVGQDQGSIFLIIISVQWELIQMSCHGRKRLQGCEPRLSSPHLHCIYVIDTGGSYQQCSKTFVALQAKTDAARLSQSFRSLSLRQGAAVSPEPDAAPQPAERDQHHEQSGQQGVTSLDILIFNQRFGNRLRGDCPNACPPKVAPLALGCMILTKGELSALWWSCYGCCIKVG